MGARSPGKAGKEAVDPVRALRWAAQYSLYPRIARLLQCRIDLRNRGMATCRSTAAVDERASRGNANGKGRSCALPVRLFSPHLANRIPTLNPLARASLCCGTAVLL